MKTGITMVYDYEHMRAPDIPNIGYVGCLEATYASRDCIPITDCS